MSKVFSRECFIMCFPLFCRFSLVIFFIVIGVVNPFHKHFAVAILLVSAFSKSVFRTLLLVGLIFIAYNFRKWLNIIVIEAFRKYFLLVFMLKRAFLSSLEAFRQPLILISKTESQKLNRLRIKIFANFMDQLFAKPDFGGGY